MCFDVSFHADLRNRGFSLLEIMTVIAIMGTLAVLGMAGFRNFVQQAALDTATGDVYTALSDARSATLASEYGEQFGVYVEANRITRFRGSAYDETSPFNQVIALPGIAVTTTLEDGPEILFERRTGRSSNHGSIRLTQGSTNASTTMTIYTSGIVSIP